VYKIHPDKTPAGWVWDWKRGVWEIWKFDTGNLPQEEQNALRKYERSDEFKALQAKRIEEERRARLAASDEARARFESTKPAQPDHPYLKRKKVNDYGLRQEGDALLVPMCDETGRFQTMQRIPADPGEKKKFYQGAPAGGAFFSIAKDVKNGPVLLCEGYGTGATLHEATGHTVVCAMSSGNLPIVAAKIRKLWPKRKIVVAADNDHEREDNPGLTKAREAAERAKLDGVIFPEFPQGRHETDWNDFAALYGLDAAEKALREKIAWEIKPDGEKKLLKRVRRGNAMDLMKTEIPPVKWAVEGFIPAGCSILSGAPKTGKSILALDLALAVSLGGMAFGKIEVERGDVLYLALEDTWIRLQERIRDFGVSDDADLSRLDLVIDIPRQNDGGLLYVDMWLKEHPNARFVIIDTLQKFRKPHHGNDDRYGADYDAIGDIKKVMDAHGVSNLTLHHTKKAKDENDWLNEISGTQGLAGAADTLLFLQRGRCQGAGIIRRTGRDVEEAEFAMTLDGMSWRLEGDAAEFEAKEWERRIIAHMKEAGSQTPKEVAESLGIKSATARKQMVRLKSKGLLTSYLGKYWIAS
jgi:phage/plasmid primase-like uncharacterized protein